MSDTKKRKEIGRIDSVGHWRRGMTKQVSWSLSPESESTQWSAEATDSHSYASPITDMSVWGTLVISNGTYVGALRDDPNASNGHRRVRHGHGTMQYANGNTYTGDWVDDRFHGNGEYIWADGRRFFGSFKDDKIDGKGTGIWPDGRKYEGEYRWDLAHGHGLVVLPSGRAFEGTFVSDFPVQGQMIEPDGTLFASTFDGKTHVSEWHPQSKQLIGKFEEGWDRADKCHMMREFAWSDGRRFAGNFMGFYPLCGVLTDIDSTQYLVEYDGNTSLSSKLIPTFKIQLRTQAKISYLPNFRARAHTCSRVRLVPAYSTDIV
jgi:hypothetical protein